MRSEASLLPESPSIFEVEVGNEERVMGGRFEREARAAARLSHPAIVTLYEAAVDDEGAYLVSELVRGETLGALLDEQDAMPGESYTLEVSSPGVERPLRKLRDFERVVGQRIKVVLREPLEGQKRVEGKLRGIDGNAIDLEMAPGESRRIAIEQIQKANLKFEW